MPRVRASRTQECVRYGIRLASGSTFLNPAGTSNNAASTLADENAVYSVVISSNVPGGACCCCCAGCESCDCFLPSPNLPARAPLREGRFDCGCVC